MTKICMEGLPGKIGRCVNTPPYWPPIKGRPVPLSVEGDAETYSEFFVDAAIVDSIHLATKGISDSGARGALQTRIESAVKAMQKRAGGGEKVTITLSE